MALKCLCKFPATIMSCSKYRVSFDKKFRPNHLTANLLTVKLRYFEGRVSLILRVLIDFNKL